MDNIQLIHGDCLEEMRKFESDVIDLTVTSPPYDNLRTYEGSCNWNFDIFKAIADELYRITKDGGVVVWVVGDATINGSETGSSFKQALYFKEIGFNLHDTMIYLKNQMAFPSTNRYYGAFEYMFVLSKNKIKTFNLIADKKNVGFGRTVCGTDRQKDGTLKNRKVSEKTIKKFGVRWNYWLIYNQDRGLNVKHPASFPLSLAEDHIKSWSNENNLILDCFMGSGTTGIACKHLNRRFIGIEKEEKYFEIAKQRIENE